MNSQFSKKVFQSCYNFKLSVFCVCVHLKQTCLILIQFYDTSTVKWITLSVYQEIHVDTHNFQMFSVKYQI